MMGTRAPIPQGKDTDSENVRVAVYARTSSVNQRFGYSLDEQVRLCVERCQYLGWEVVFMFRDEAESGKDTERPMFQAMMDEAKRGQFEVVIFWKLDRLSRSLLHAVQIESELQDQGVALYSVTEQIDTTSSAGRFNFRNLASAAEFEREMIQERSKMGLKARALEGQWPNDNPPFGYELTDDGRLSVLPSEAVVVRWIFNRYLTVKSMPQIAQRLEKRRNCANHRTHWDASAVREILSNELYIGCFDIAGVSRDCPEYRILCDELFSAVTETRFRFRTGTNERPKMNTSRKESIVSECLRRYQAFLEEDG